MYTNNKMLLQVIALLKAHNINKIVISPGSRHYPLIHSLELDSFFELYSIVDERSAAFFALGLIQKTNEPVVVCCTSGSALQNYGSAVSEAYYQNLPLLLITADRLPAFLGQKEDQMIDQKNIFKGKINYSCQLPLVKSEIDEWYANRVINEACIRLFQHGKGPVHINYPILSHASDTFDTVNLPDIRTITYNPADTNTERWKTYDYKLTNKKIMIVWGQSVNLTDKLKKTIDNFCNRYNCVILTDRISNFHHSNAIDNAFVILYALSLEERNRLFPDIVISVGGNNVFNPEIKGYLKAHFNRFENWQVGHNNNICDPYHHLTDMFEMNEQTFFQNVVASSNEELLSSFEYFKGWKEASELIEEPNVEYNQLYVTGKLLKSLPDNSILHLANSHTIRVGHMFDFNKTVSCYCNRGVNGIDGCMSTAVGYASVSSEMNFLIIGDLAFFYDMNALWNRYVPKNLRILLINNGAGAVMHNPGQQKPGNTLKDYKSAGHNTSAKGWVESLGIKYFAVTNKEEADKSIEIFKDPKNEGPIFIEAFTDAEDDMWQLHKYISKIKRISLSERVKGKAKSMLSKYLK